MKINNLTKSGIYLAAAFGLFSLARFALFLSYLDLFRILGRARIPAAFLGGLRFDGAAIMTFFGIPLILLNLPFGFTSRRWWQRLWGWLLYLIILILLLVLVGDIVYFGMGERHVGSELLLLGNDLDAFLGTILNNYPFAIAGFLLFALLLAWFWKKLVSLPVRTAPRYRAIGGFLLVAVLAILGNRGTFARKSLHIIDAFASGNTLQGNLTLNGVFSSYQFIRKAPVPVDYDFFEPEELERITGLDLDREYPLSARFSDRRPNGHNLVLIILESWGAHFLDSFSPEGPGVTENFDYLAARGRIFPNFYAIGRWSLYGIQAIMTGVPTLPGIPMIGNGLEVSAISKLGEIARDNDYRTIFVQSSRRRSFRLDAVARSLGFEEMYGMEDIPVVYPYPEESRPKFGWDYDTFLFLLETINAGGDRPFLATVFTGTTHIPFVKIDERFEVFPYAESGREGFLNTLKYADWSLGEFFRRAAREPWFDNTIFVLTADHSYEGRNFVERFRIPLVIFAPSIQEPGVNHTVGSQLDIMPTIIDLLGFDDEFTALGESLFRKRKDWSLVFDNEIPAIISSRGYLRHSLRNRLDSGSFSGENDPGYFAGLEKNLLGMNQVAYQLLKSNRWAGAGR
ncbi:MAG: LTA synthase family protein [Candidatus Erginobacter occultus]|nr:LTA synthase family protein [Candidatus Erginobacter occultus]